MLKDIKLRLKRQSGVGKGTIWPSPRLKQEGTKARHHRAIVGTENRGWDPQLHASQIDPLLRRIAFAPASVASAPTASAAAADTLAASTQQVQP